MTASRFIASPQLEQATVDAIGVLGMATTELRRMRADVREFEAVHELMYLYSLALLADQRGRHLVGRFPDKIDVDEDRDLAELLDSAHDQLTAQTTGLEPFVVLEFVSEVGAVCRGVRRYAHGH